MFQTDVSTAASSLPAPSNPGTPGFFTAGNPAEGVPATVLDNDFMNMIMMELINVVEAGGLTPSKTTYNQLLTAIKTIVQSGVSQLCTDTGAANAYATTMSPALTAPTDGAPFWMKVSNVNTGPSTLNATGAVYPLVGAGHAALQGNEMAKNGWALIEFDSSVGTNGSYVLRHCTGGIMQVAGLYASGILCGVNLPNMLFNCSAEFGNAGWTPGNFSAVTGAAGEGTYWSNTSALAATAQDTSSQFAVSAAVPLTISLDVYASGVTAGRAYAYVEAFTSAGVSLGAVCAAYATIGAGWKRYAATGTTPANTSYCVVHRVVDSTPAVSAAGVGFRRIKVEGASQQSLYSMEASLAAFGATLAANSYQKLPSGWIIQKGVAGLTTGNGDVVTLPLAFPNQLFGVVGSDQGGGCNSTSWARNGSSLSTFLGYGKAAGTNTNSATTYSYIAIGC
ncbi:hypothetical protein AB3X91_09130 [Paraburkholderia sp. BR14263]|uniref:gp53-like domain-containing protein n=1 Tax=unclassified Paraburkholderia TaxID=2615204 RepID=UPI0034CFCC88